ncbi:ATP-binding protein [Methylobacterium thuringiense]|uniref:histidine kinase n=1 Tax=Methylobacterium thuringiense TaxID=1003091 RepID=A0ABQ4TG84_9HYPH|nr:ATP-binding protein [Methylobacterium thuringiense]GJE53583.1 Blue-light-activated protein [Methylobacterium thuringiense]
MPLPDAMPSPDVDGTFEVGDAGLAAHALALLTASPVPAFVVADGVITAVNPALATLSGHAAEELVGGGIEVLQTRQGDHAAWAVLREAVAAGRTAGADLLCLRKNGSSFWAAIQVAPLGTPPVLIGQVVDITRRVDAEGALVLSQQREALGLLTNSVAHEFNNFLQILIGYVDGLKRRLADRQEPFIQRAVTRSTEAAERAAILTRHLLTHSRRIAPDVRAVDLDAFIDSIAESLRAALPPRIDLVFATTHDMVPALCNPTQVELALRHILANSAEATAGSGAITVATFAVAPGDRTLQRPSDGAVGIAVSDRGHGMSPEMLTRALAPFATSREAGRGVGLAIVHGLMKRQNGTVSLESRPGEGTTVRLIFPAAP